MLMRFFSRGAW